ncbi:MAG TPA: CHAT domain-containing protein [Thermoanaerobaculia bacterium]|jgi:hypothetical protein|nr:CHAT domain-containing protein [Thermoanaerobaculia bacterium]
MLQLRLTQRPDGKGRHRVEVSLKGDGARRLAESTFDFLLLDQDEEDLRWYLEDYLQYPQDPAPAIARRIEARMAEIGTELFHAVFQGSGDARDLWAVLRGRLPDTRVEIVTGVSEANAIPWELLRDPKMDTPLALAARSFVRAQPARARRPYLPKKKRDKIRILLVICRPKGDEDVPFRSVASRLIKGLDEASREAYDLDVLRPPTFEQLGRVLRQAEQDGRPYHAVHFDGHGTYGEIAGRPGRQGSVFFEGEFGGDADPVDGSGLGGLLAEARVPVLVLNACRSARAEPADRPDPGAGPDSQAQAFGSLAEEVVAAGVAGVVAMRYNVYVVTAAQLVAELYASLGRGGTLGEAVTLARRNLHGDPLREVAFDPRPLQDWTVPVVYEAAPVQLFPKTRKRTGSGPRSPRIKAGDMAMADGSLDSSLPPPPAAGFFGRDETLLALDQAFNHDSIVLLHAYAGSGKTSTAAEFARWYSLTGGIEGPVLFTSFERYLPLPRVLDQIGQIFEASLEEQGIHWLTLDDPARRETALRILSQTPVLWIWDNVEPVTGFPAGTESAWSAREQDELVRFLKEARRTKALFLLTSRRDESAWLGLVPFRVTVPPMPLLESLQLVRALAVQRGRRLSGAGDWRPLLEFAQGNPMTVTVLVGQALREGFATKQEIQGFVERLRSGEAAFIDERDEGRSRSLGASLAYGFENAFNEEERGKLALLHFFQGFVDVDALCLMGAPETSWCLPEVRDLTREEGIGLLDRAAEVGLLTARGDGRYSIHPVLPWFFKGLFAGHYAREGLAAARAFVEAVGGLGNYYHDEYRDGNTEAVNRLRAEEANLLHARQLAKDHGWWEPLLAAMQGLRQSYAHTGRRAEWKRLVEEIVPCFVDPVDDSPLPDWEEEWSIVMSYRVRLAHEERRWSDAERLQERIVAWVRRRAAPFLDRPVTELEEEERNVLKRLGTSLNELGHIRLELGQADCVPAYEEALSIADRIGNRTDAAVYAVSLGRAFLKLPGLQDLDQAEHWFQKSLDLRVEADRLGRGSTLADLGSIALRRFQLALAAGQPLEESFSHLYRAANLYQDSLDWTPPDVAGDLAVLHNQLAMIYQGMGDVESSLSHSRQAILEHERTGNLFAASQSRSNTAVTLLIADRRADALEYAEAALRGFEGYGEKAAEEIERTRQLIAKIRGRGLPAS